MSSETFKVNYPAFFLGFLGLALVPIGMILLGLSKFWIGFPIILIGANLFITVMMMSAKTTGGPQD